MNKKELVQSILYGDYGSLYCLRECMKNTCENAVAIGFYLDEIQVKEYWKFSESFKKFKPSSYKTEAGIIKFTKYTFYDFCSLELGLSRRSVDRFLNIFKAFASVSSSGVRQKFVDDKYKDYSASQLSEMLGLADKSKVNPGMTVNEIREVKKAETNNVYFSPGVEPEQEEPEGTFVNLNQSEALHPDVADIQLKEKTYKKKKYYPSTMLYDTYVSTPSQYSQQFIKLQDYLNKGYLVRLVLYSPEEEKDIC